MDLFLRRSRTGQTMPREGAKEMLPSVPEFSLRKISLSQHRTLQHEMQDFVHRENCG